MLKSLQISQCVLNSLMAQILVSHNPNKKVSRNFHNVEEGLMNKIKLFLFSMAIIVIASTSFMGIAMAAQVTGINKSKGHVHINGGVNDGFIPGATVCFFVSSVSYGDEFVCGSVVSAEASIATVKVSKSRAKIFLRVRLQIILWDIRASMT